MNAPLYKRGYSFSGFQSNQPQRPLPAQQLDIELDSIARSFASQQAQIQALRPGGGPGLPAIDLPIAGRSLKVNLLSSPAIPQVVLIDQFKAELGIGGGGGLPDWTDVQNKPIFGNAALRNVGASAGTVAAGDDSRIVGALQAALNGSDIPNKGLFRAALGLKNTALLDVGTAAGTVAAGDDPRFNAVGLKTIRDYGAKMDGVTDDGPAMRAQYVAENCVRLGDGTIYLNSVVGVEGDAKGAQVYGNGISRTKLKAGPNAMFYLSGHGFQMRDFQVEPTGVVTAFCRLGRANEKGEIDNNAWLIRSLRFVCGGPDRYIKNYFEGWQCWYGSIEDIQVYGGRLFTDFLGEVFKWHYSTNVNVVGCYFLGVELAYHWTKDIAPGQVYNCEGHTFQGNIWAANKRHFLFEGGLYPLINGNIIDLCKQDGCPIESSAFLTTITNNWFATILNAGEIGAPIKIYNSDSHVIQGNSFAGNDRTGTALVLTNCNFCLITGNSFRFYFNQFSASGCDTLLVALNIFVGFANCGCNLYSNTNVRYIGNIERGNVGSVAGKVLPPGVYDPTDPANASSQAPAYVVSFVYTTQQSAQLQQFDVPLPAGRFSSVPIATANLGGALGIPIEVSIDHANCTTNSVRVTFRRADGVVIDAGQAYRFNINARQQD